MGPVRGQISAHRSVAVNTLWGVGYSAVRDVEV